nr:putative reverse transcriptase domain-containing protein [Tanacetum cinerariifolium]
MVVVMGIAEKPGGGEISLPLVMPKKKEKIPFGLRRGDLRTGEEGTSPDAIRDMIVHRIGRRMGSKVIAYTARQLKAHGKNYTTNELELRAVVFDLKNLRRDRLTNLAYYLAIREDYKMEKLGRLYIDEIVARHGVPVSIISDRDGRFTSSFWSPVLWAEIGKNWLIGPELVQKTTDKVVLIKERIKATRYRQKSYADNRRKPLEFKFGDQVLLKVSPWKGPVAYRLRLPQELSGVHDTFHVSNLKKCLADANLHVPLGEVKIDKTLRFVEEP